jgi:hypothetical protein
MNKNKLTPGKGAAGKSKAPDQPKPPIMTPPMDKDGNMLSYPWQAYFDELTNRAVINVIPPAVQATINIDGGSANSTYAEG